MKKVRTAVLGYGHLGKWHAEKAEELSDLVAIVDVDPANRKRAKKRHPNVKVVEKIEEILDLVEAAIVVTPTSFHYPIVKYLLEQNKHIFCEKPLVSHLNEAEDLVRIHQSKNVVVQVGHSERFHESWEIIDKFQTYLKGQSIIRMNRFAPFKGRATDVDVVQDLMIHDLDLLVYLFKEMPISVRSTGYKIRTDNWDYVCSEFVFNSGKRAFLVASRNHVKEVRDLEVTNDLGCLYVDLFHNTVQIATQERAQSGDYFESLQYSRRDHLLIEQKHFYDSILNGVPPIVSINDGLKAVKLISKVLESLETQALLEISD
jgi:predicted dehydrogenase